MHQKKRLEIIVEAPVLNRLTDLLDRLEVGGYTIVPALGGKGRGGSWSREGQATDAGRMIVIIVIIDAKRLDEIVEPIFALVQRQVGIMAISDVLVVRGEHF